MRKIKVTCEWNTAKKVWEVNLYSDLTLICSSIVSSYKTAKLIAQMVSDIAEATRSLCLSELLTPVGKFDENELTREARIQKLFEET